MAHRGQAGHQPGDNRVRGDRPEQLRLAAQHRHIRLAAPAQRQCDRQVGEDLSRALHRPGGPSPFQRLLQAAAEPRDLQAADQQQATGLGDDAASVTDDIPAVIAAAFAEAERRDPRHRREWVALLDGNNPQIEAVTAEAARRGVTITILIDLIHVLEYLWKAAWSFFDKGEPAAEAWVADQARTILHGKVAQVAAGIRRRATTYRYAPAERAGADECARYLTVKAPHLDYAPALAKGWPIATGVIEGACRHLVKDRMDITGARWGLGGAEAILKLRALIATGDFEPYWRYHLRKEHERSHGAHGRARFVLAA